MKKGAVSTGDMGRTTVLAGAALLILAGCSSGPAERSAPTTSVRAPEGCVPWRAPSASGGVTVALHLDVTSGPARFARIGHVTIHNGLSTPIRVQEGGALLAMDLLPGDRINGGNGNQDLPASASLAPGASRDVAVSLSATGCDGTQRGPDLTKGRHRLVAVVNYQRPPGSPTVRSVRSSVADFTVT